MSQITPREIVQELDKYIISQSDANVVELAEGVNRTLNQLSEELPPDIKLTVVNDNSVFIRDSIHEILFNIQFGTLLAVLVIFLFLLDFRELHC